jgi:glutaredoxin
MNIEIYTSPGCSWCKKALTLMEMAKITDYKKYVLNVDITSDEIKKKFPNMAGYPIIIIDDVSYDIIETVKLFVEKGLVSSKKNE